MRFDFAAGGERDRPGLRRSSDVAVVEAADVGQGRDGAILFTFDPRKSRIHNVGGAAASPAIYVVNGREFVAYAFGGNVPDRNNFGPPPNGGPDDGATVDPDSGKVGDAIIAFALPDGD